MPAPRRGSGRRHGPGRRRRSRRGLSRPVPGTAGSCAGRWPRTAGRPPAAAPAGSCPGPRRRRRRPSPPRPQGRGCTRRRRRSGRWRTARAAGAVARAPPRACRSGRGSPRGTSGRRASPRCHRRTAVSRPPRAGCARPARPRRPPPARCRAGRRARPSDRARRAVRRVRSRPRSRRRRARTRRCVPGLRPARRAPRRCPRRRRGGGRSPATRRRRGPRRPPSRCGWRACWRASGGWLPAPTPCRGWHGRCGHRLRGCPAAAPRCRSSARRRTRAIRGTAGLGLAGFVDLGDQAQFLLRRRCLPGLQLRVHPAQMGEMDTAPGLGEEFAGERGRDVGAALPDGFGALDGGGEGSGPSAITSTHQLRASMRTSRICQYQTSDRTRQIASCSSRSATACRRAVRRFSYSRSSRPTAASWPGPRSNGSVVRASSR